MNLIDTATAAVALGITDRQVRNLVTNGTLTNHGTARKIRVDVAQVAHLYDTRGGHHVAH